MFLLHDLSKFSIKMSLIWTVRERSCILLTKMVGTCVNVKIWLNTPSLGMIYKLAPDTDEGSNVGDVADHFKNKLCSQENNLDKIKIV